MKLFFTIILMLISVNTYANNNINKSANAGVNMNEKSTFTDGPVIVGYGKHATVKQSFPLDRNADYKVVFDISKQSDSTEVNRKINTLARFINMHVANGIPLSNIHLALVAHGKAGFDLLNDEAYKNKFTQDNPNTELLTKLLENNVQIILCGQSAAYYKIENKQLNKGVKMALSAMTAHNVLQRQGYTLNPF